MSELKKWPAGTWVEVGRVVLPPAERAPQVPADTAAVPLELKVRGFLKEEKALGEEAEVTTLVGRVQQGTLLTINPRHRHGFGEPVPELLPIGSELRALLGGGSGE